MSQKLRDLAQTLIDGMAKEGYAIEQLEDDARRLAEMVLAKIADDSVAALPEWCPVCHTYHTDPGVKTDAGRVTRACPISPPDAVWNQVAR